MNKVSIVINKDFTYTRFFISITLISILRLRFDSILLGILRNIYLETSLSRQEERLSPEVEF